MSSLTEPGRAEEATAGAESDDLPLTVIEPTPGWRLVDFGELWRFRELLYFLIWRDVKVRYKQTVFGVGWAVAQPLATMLVFTLFLGRMGGISSGIPDYALYVFAGLVPWTFFSNAVSTAGNSVVGNQNLITKVYFPRLIVPFATIGACLFDFVIACGLLAIMAVWYAVVPGWGFLLLPFIIAMLVLTAAGVGVFLAALIVAQRDFRFLLTFGMQMWMFATPSIYLSAESIGPKAQAILPLNPAFGLILNFRNATIGTPIDWYALGVSSAVGLVVCVIGAAYFRRTERRFADVI